MKETIQLSIKDTNKIQKIAKALVSETRLEILKLLDREVLNVSEIAERCGYPDASHFMKLFRKKKGMTASEYRNTAKQKAGSQ